MKTKISITLNEHLLQDVDGIVDNVFIRNRSQAIEYLVEKALASTKSAVILAGGSENILKLKKGYRVTAKINNLSLVERAVKKLSENGFKRISIVARHNVLTAVFDILKDGSGYGVEITYVEEKKSAGTADSLRLLKGKLSSNFLVVYGDILFDKINIERLWEEHLKHNAITTIMLTTSSRPSEKGTVKVEGNKVLNFTQKPKQSDIYLVFSPIFVASPQLFEYQGSSLEKNVFPELAEKGLLNGHLSSEKERHIHSEKDL